MYRQRAMIFPLGHTCNSIKNSFRCALIVYANAESTKRKYLLIFVLGESNFRTDLLGHGVVEHYDILIENHTNLIERSITVSLRTPTSCEN